MKKIFLIIFLFNVSFVLAQNENRFIKGKVIDSLIVQNDSINESFALYLPPQFDPSKKWPFIFIFDQEGRGRRGAHVFSQAAAKYGYVLIGSNNFKRGKIQDNVKVYNRLFFRVAEMFSNNIGRIYTAGFSGGARLATSIAVLSKNLDGVIACNAGFSPAYQPDKNTFSFIGIVGDTDFNYLEMFNTVAFLKQKRFNTELFVFEGGHEWPPSSVIQKAIESIELKKQIKGSADYNETLVARLYESDYKEAESLIADKKPIRAIEALKRMQANYRLHFETDSLKTKARDVRRDKESRQLILSNENALNLERTIRLNFFDFFNEDLETIVFDNLGWWEDQVEMLNTNIKGSDIGKQKMSKRLKSMLNTLGRETLIGVDEKKESDKALYLNIFLTLVEPTSYDAYLNIMKISTQKSNYDMALYYTEELFKNGFKNRDKLYSVKGMSLLRITPEFMELVNKYL